MDTRFNLFSDIDWVLCDTNVLDINQAKFYKARGNIVTEPFTHYFFPGIKEFLQALYDRNNLTISFFKCRFSGEKCTAYPALDETAVSRRQIG